MTKPPFDLAQAHRWFAVESNNVAWDLVEADERTPAEMERMIHASHAACFHWLEVGDGANHLRAQVLLATAYVKARLAEAAVCHAERALCLKNDESPRLNCFDRAIAHGCASAAYALAGAMDRARFEYDLAKQAVAGFDEPSETALFAKLYPDPSTGLKLAKPIEKSCL